ncbi:MAG: hypothetical protein KAR11_00530 [Phycisphaerae bacterium]|nr:hypothetical protein [Phycisphaerae bacterium]
MKSKTTIIFVLLLIAGGAVVGLERAGMFKSQTQLQNVITDRHLFIPAPVNPKRLSIENMSGTKLVFVKNATGDWEITHPVSGSTKPGRVEKLVSTLTAMQYVDQFDPLTRDGLDDMQTRLAEPRWIVSLYDTDGGAYTLLVGREVPAVGTSKRNIETYVRVKGSQKTCVVAEDLSALLCRSSEDFCDTTNSAPPVETEFVTLPGSVLDYNLPSAQPPQKNDTTKDNE